MDAPQASVEAANTGNPAETSTTSPPPETTPVLSLMERLKARVDAESDSDSAPDAASSSPADATGDAPTGEPATEKAPEPPKSEDQRLELAHGRALDSLKKATGENVSLKAANAKLTGELSSLKERAKADPLAVIAELHGSDWREILQKAARGDFDKRTPQVPPEIAEKLAYLDKLREREEARQREEARRADMEADKPRVAKILESDADKFPILASFEDSADLLLETYYDDQSRGDETNFLDLCKRMEESGTQTATAFFTNRKLVAHLVNSNQAVRQALSEALGLTKQQAAVPQAANRDRSSPTAPRTLASATEVPSRSDREDTDEERRAESIRLWREHRTAQRL